jgi:hypothetical protein
MPQNRCYDGCGGVGLHNTGGLRAVVQLCNFTVSAPTAIRTQHQIPRKCRLPQVEIVEYTPHPNNLLDQNVI